MQANALEICRRNCPELNDFLHINFLHIQVDLWRLRQGRAGLSGGRKHTENVRLYLLDIATLTSFTFG